MTLATDVAAANDVARLKCAPHALPVHLCLSSCSFPNLGSDEFEDEEEKAEFYRIIGAVTRGEELPKRYRGSTSRGTGRLAGSQGAGHRHGRGGGRNAAAAAATGEPVPGWQPTEQYTMSGQQLFSGMCSSCGQQCTVPFRPVQGRAPPCCRTCHAGSSRAGGAAAQASGVRHAGGA